MCGVCGIVWREKQLEAVGAEASVRQMLTALDHRGPEDSDVAVGPTAVFGAARLAIRGIDSGQQPLVDPSTGVTVVCNGEIDNHSELRSWLAGRGRSVTLATDVAVLPGLYLELGDAFVERLVGAFSIAVWDPRRGRLILARDRAGERPLFYLEAEGSVAFATEIAAFAADPAFSLDPDVEALTNFLRSGAFIAPHAPLERVRKVRPAEIVAFEADKVERRRYWRWSIGTEPKAAPQTDAFDHVFRQAVRRQTDVDVPYGVFLSGGLDSSLIAAVARSVRPEQQLRAYTVRFDEESYDEGSFAERVAELLGLEMTSVQVSAEQFPEQIAKIVALVGEPLGDPAWIPTVLLAQRAARDVKMVLVGEGGDEVFGGYPTYIGALMSDRYARLPPPFRTLLTSMVRRWPVSDKKVSMSFLLKRFVAGAGMDGVARHVLWTSSLTPALLDRLGCSTSGAYPVADVEGELLDLLQRMDLETSLAEGLLTKGDRAAMGSALEPRAPFLDRDVMEFAATLPVSDRVRRFRTKVFLKRYARRYLPGSIVYRRKRGLSVPLSQWLRGPLHEWARDRLAEGRLELLRVRTAAALELLEEHVERRADHAKPLWTLLVLTQWLEWLESRSAASASRPPGLPGAAGEAI